MCFALPLFPLVLLLVSCSSAPPDPTYYLLRSEPFEGVQQIGGDERVGLARIVVAPYLTMSRGIVIETAPRQVRPARLHQWAEPLEQGIHWFLHGELSRALGDRVGAGLIDARGWDYLVDIYVVRLHATLAGQAKLEAAYVIRAAAPGVQSREHRFAKSLPLPEEGYRGAVAAEHALLRDLGAAIVQSLREVMEPAPPAL
jgi:uncharacterized lipoprotein YmbA